MDLADGDPIFCWKSQCPPRSALQAVKLRLSRFPPTFPQVMLFYSIYSTSEFERLCVMTACRWRITNNALKEGLLEKRKRVLDQPDRCYSFGPRCAVASWSTQSSSS